MANSGYKNWLTLRKYINGVATDETKTNDAADADYIAPVIDLSACGTAPNTCPQLTSPIADKTATVGDANISIDLSAVFTGGDADPLTYTAVSSNNVAVSTEIQGSTLILSVVGGSAATSTISVTCSDGTCAATDSFVFTLNAAATTAPPTTTTTTTTQAPTCPALVTIADTAFTTVTSSQTYTSLGGYCIQDGYSTEYGKWYIDTSGSTLSGLQIFNLPFNSRIYSDFDISMSSTFPTSGIWKYEDLLSNTEISTTPITWTTDSSFSNAYVSWSFGNSTTSKNMMIELFGVQDTQNKWVYVHLEPFVRYLNQFNLQVGSVAWDGSLTAPLVTTRQVNLAPSLADPIMANSSYATQQYSESTLLNYDNGTE